MGLFPSIITWDPVHQCTPRSPISGTKDVGTNGIFWQPKSSFHVHEAWILFACSLSSKLLEVQGQEVAKTHLARQSLTAKARHLKASKKGTSSRNHFMPAKASPDTTLVYTRVTPALSLCRARMAVNSFCTVNLSSPRLRSFPEYCSTTSGCASLKLWHTCQAEWATEENFNSNAITSLTLWMCQYLLAPATSTSTLRHLTCNRKVIRAICLNLQSEHPRGSGTARLRFAPPSCPCVSGGQLTPSEKPPGSSWLQQLREASATKPQVEAPSKSYAELCLVHTPNISQHEISWLSFPVSSPQFSQIFGCELSTFFVEFANWEVLILHLCHLLPSSYSVLLS